MKVYESAKAEVQRQIILRLTILRAWLRDGVPWRTQPSGIPVRDSEGERVLEYFPQKITHFPSWTAAMHTGDILHRQFSYGEDIAHLDELQEIGRSTLYQPIYDSTRKAVDNLLPILVEAAEIQLKNSNKRKQIDSLTEQVQLLTKIVENQESEARVMRMQLRSEITTRRKSQRKCISNMRQLESDNEQLRKQVAELTATLNQVRTLKAVPKKRHD